MANGLNVHANGVRQHLLRFVGPGPQLLLVPGITSPAITWGFVAERLAARFDVYVLDVRGRGLSEAGDLNYSLDALADDSLALIEVCGLNKPVLLGHSMGARVGIRAARRNRDAFGGLILADPPVSGPGRRKYPSDWSWYRDSIRLAEKGCTAQEMRTYCPTWSMEHLALRAEWLHTCQLSAIEAAFDGFNTDDIHSDLQHLKVPVRLIRAGASPVILDEDLAEMKLLLPALETRVVEGAGHMIPWDDLDGFLAAVMDFQAST